MKGTEMLAKTHRGWTIRFDPPPVPYRDFDYVATHPDYDVWMEDGEEVSNGKIVHAPTLNRLIVEIDNWEKENA